MNPLQRTFAFGTSAILLCAVSLASCGGSEEEKLQTCLDKGDYACARTEANNLLATLGSSSTPPSDAAGYASWVLAKRALAEANLGEAGFDMRKFLHAAVDISKAKDKNKEAFDIIKKKVFGVDTSKSEDVWVPQLNAQLIKVFAAEKELEELLYDKGSLDGRSGTTAIEVDADTGLPNITEYNCGEASSVASTGSTSKTGTSSATSTSSTTTTTTTATTTKKQTGTGTTTTTGGKTGTTGTTTTTSSSTASTSTGSKLCRTLPSGTTDQTRYLLGDSEWLLGMVLLTRTIMEASLMGLDTVFSSADLSAAIKKSALCVQFEADCTQFDPFGTSKRYTLQKSLADITGAFAFVINSDSTLSTSAVKDTFESIKTQISDTKSKAIDPAIESACSQIDTIATQAETQLKSVATSGASVSCAKDTGNLSCTVSVSQTLPAPISQTVTAKIVLPITVGDPKKDCKDELKEKFGPTGIDEFLCKDKDSSNNLKVLSAATPRVCDSTMSADLCPTQISTTISPETVLGQDAKTLLKQAGFDLDSQLTSMTSKFNTVVSDGLSKVKDALDNAFGSPVTRGAKFGASTSLCTKATASTSSSTTTTSSTSTTSTSATTSTGSTK